MASTQQVVVTDTNILINLIHVGRLDMLGQLPGYEFAVPEQVVIEVTDVTGVKPPVDNRLVGLFGLFVVTLHDQVSANEDLAVLGDLHLDVGKRLAHRPEFHILECVY